MESSDQVLNNLSDELTLTLTADDELDFSEDGDNMNEVSYVTESNLPAKDEGTRSAGIKIDKDVSLEKEGTLESKNYPVEYINELSKLEEDCEDFSKDFENSIYVRISGFKKSEVSENTYASWYKFFKETVGIDVPLIHPPGDDSQMISFKFKSVDDRNKLLAYCQNGGKFEEEKLIVKPRILKVNRPELWNGIGLLSLEEALDLLYPYRNKLYAKQLSEKYKRQKELITSQLFPAGSVAKYSKVKKPLKKIRGMKYIASCIPTDGYENNVIIVTEKSVETEEVVYGLRVLNNDKNSTTIVPLEHCLSVPRQIAIVSKKIISSLLDSGLGAFCPSTGKGDLLGIILRIAKLNSLILTVMVNVVDAPKFYEFSSDGIICNENEKSVKDLQFKVIVENHKKEITEKLKNFFDINGKNLGISAVFHLPLLCQYSLIMTSEILQKIMKKPSYIAGDSELLHKLNGILVPIPWDKEMHPEIYDKAILFFDQTFIHSKTHLFLLSPIKEIGYYFAKKCKTVTQIETSQRDLAGHSKPLDCSNLVYWFYNTKLRMPKNSPIVNTVIIWWPLVNSNFKRINADLKVLEQLLEFKIPNLACLTFWSPPNKNLSLYKKLFKTIYASLRINKVSIFDYEPYRLGCGMFTLFRGRHDEVLIPTQTTLSAHRKGFSQQGGSQKINRPEANIQPPHEFEIKNVPSNKTDLKNIPEMRKHSSRFVSKSGFVSKKAPDSSSRQNLDLSPSPPRYSSRREGLNQRLPDHQRIHQPEFSHSPNRVDSHKRKHLCVSPPRDMPHRGLRQFSPKPRQSKTPDRYKSHRGSSNRGGSPYSPAQDVYYKGLSSLDERTPDHQMQRETCFNNFSYRTVSPYSPRREDHHKEWPRLLERNPEYHMSRNSQNNNSSKFNYSFGRQNPSPVPPQPGSDSYVPHELVSSKSRGLYDSFGRKNPSPDPPARGTDSSAPQELVSSKSLVQVVQNLQNMAKEMEVLINRSRETLSIPEPSFNWAQKRRYPEGKASPERNTWQGRSTQDNDCRELYKLENHYSPASKRRKEDVFRHTNPRENHAGTLNESKFSSQVVPNVPSFTDENSKYTEKWGRIMHSDRDLGHWKKSTSSNDYYSPGYYH